MADVIQIAFEAVDRGLTKELDRIDTELTQLERQIENTSKTAARLGVTSEEVARKMGSIGKAATIGVTLPIAGIAIAATKAASDLSETTNKIDTLFGNSSKAIQDWSKTASTALGQSRKQALDAAADFAVFGKAAGLAGNDLVKFSQQNVQLASDMASFFNTSPEEAITAIGSAFRGESEPIRRYGVLINEASLKDEALRLGLIKTTTEALQPQARVLAAQALIMKQTSAAQGDFAKTSDGLANSTRIVNAQLQDTLATLGEKLLPIVLKGAVAIKDLLTAFQGLPEPMQDAIIAFAGIAAAAGPVLTIGGKLVGMFGGIKGHIPGLVGGLRDFSTVLKGIEFGVIIAGLTVIIDYLGRVSKAASATSEDLIEMSRSGDLLDQAAASTEILVNGQNRLKDAVDGTHKKIIEGAKDYADYRSSIEATAAAAGFQIDAQGNLVKVMSGMGGQIVKVIEANYAMVESEYALLNVGRTRGEIARDMVNQLVELGRKTEAYNAAQQAAIDPEQQAIEAAKTHTEVMKEYSNEMLLNVQRYQEKQAASAAAAEAEATHRASIAESIKSVDSLAQSLAKATDAQAKQILAQAQLDVLKKAYEDGKISQEGFQKATDAVLLRYDLATPKSLAMAEAQREINKAFSEGRIPLDAFVKSSERIPKLAADGKVTMKELADIGVRPTTKAVGEQTVFVNDLTLAWDKVPREVTTTYTIETEGEAPNIPTARNIPGAQSGADFIVPPNPYGRVGDYFPILAAPGERVTVQTKSQQANAPARGGDTVTYNYNTNVFNPLAAAMLADKQRRDRLARSNARMGVV